MPGLLLIYSAILRYSDRFGRYQALAGQRTPCVGNGREATLYEASYAACAENGPSAGAEGAAAVIVQICRMRPGITPELARLEIVSGLMNLGTSCADFKGAGI
jgi:hypothetical protein